jgi:hypothetical protein
MPKSSLPMPMAPPHMASLGIALSSFKISIKSRNVGAFGGAGMREIKITRCTVILHEPGLRKHQYESIQEQNANKNRVSTETFIPSVGFSGVYMLPVNKRFT